MAAVVSRRGINGCRMLYRCWLYVDRVLAATGRCLSRGCRGDCVAGRCLSLLKAWQVAVGCALAGLWLRYCCLLAAVTVRWLPVGCALTVRWLPGCYSDRVVTPRRKGYIVCV